ncbi:MAG: ArnT family glycosyltransferase [Bdellovibrionales bacterium]
MKIYRLWLLTLVCKLVLALFLPLSSDESYYWVWSQHLRLSYYDHPPTIAYLIALGNLLGDWNQILRFPTVLLGHLTILVWFEILKPYLDEKKQIPWFWLMVLNPLAGWGSILALPDTPALFFWSLSLLCGVRWVETKKYSWAFAFGSALGLGFLSKYHIVLIVPPLLAWFLYEKKWQGIPFGQYMAIIVSGLFFCLPVLLWNYQNDFISFKFQLQHGLGAKKYHFEWTLTYVLSQIGLLFPTTLYFLFKKNPKPQLSWMAYVGWFPILFFFFSSFKGRAEGNWPILAYPTLYSLAVIQANQIKWAKGTAITWAVCLALVLSEVFFRWVPIQKDGFKTSEFYRYDGWIPIYEKYQPFYASTFQMASTLSYKLKRPVYKMAGVGRKDFYDFLPEAKGPNQKFYLAAHIWDNFLGTTVDNYNMTNIIRLEEPMVLMELTPK